MKFVPKGRKFCTNPKVVWNDCILTWVNTFNYLGYTICNEKNGDDDEIEKRMCKMRVQANVLGLRFAKASFKVKKKLFSTFLAPFIV